MAKIDFKRKKEGTGAWGAGLDYLFKDNWGDLDKLIEDSYHGRHNEKLINPLFLKIFSALEKAFLFMEKHGGWGKKAWAIHKFGSSAKTLNEKVIFIDAVTQFLRATYLGKTETAKVIKKTKAISKLKIKEIKGVVASIGRLKNIIGTAKIILSEKDFSKIKKGDILVAKETSASFLPAMLKAKAIVTDFGGILCHAAIVSRELKIPCIVGIKIATQVFKNGDKIEIDIKSGFVKIQSGIIINNKKHGN